MQSHTKQLATAASSILMILTWHQLNYVTSVQSAAAISSGQQQQRAGHSSAVNKVITSQQQQPKISEQETTANGPTSASQMFESISEQQHDSKREATATTTTNNNNLESSALNYLQRYGYMSAPANGAETNNLVSEESFSSAVLDFQRFAGIAPTGLVDKETLELMRLPRCGNSDKWQPQPQQHSSSSADQEPSASNRPKLINKVGHLNQTRSRLADSLRRRRRKRYALQGSKWRRQELTYRISQYPTRFNGKRNEVDAQIAKAFGIWSQVAPIDFVVKKEGRVHIDIRFASGDHGDGDAFDGPGNTLAHAYFPQYGGDAHFDDQEFWTIDSYAGTNIFQVAAHELGHSLGLGHSNVREALMAPFYQKYKPNFRLHMDDVLAIQALYGEKAIIPLDLESNSLLPFDGGHPSRPGTTSSPTTTSTTTTTTTSTTTNRPKYPIYRGLKPFPPFDAPPRRQPEEQPDQETPASGSEGGHAAFPDLSTNGIGGDDTGSAASMPADLCTDSAIDAATRTEDGSSYVFKGDFYWLLTQEGLARGYPRRISADWDGLPGRLDAALTWADGKTFFFKGNKYWRFRNKRRDVGYPKLISAGFAGIPDDIDAAFVWSGNGRTYIFKGAEYWRFDSKSDPPVSGEYPRPIKVWSGVPAYVDAALKWENNVTYFFKGGQYYRFNDREFKVETKGRPAFPRQTAEWWFGCVNTNLAQRALSSSLRESRTMNEIGHSSSIVDSAAAAATTTTTTAASEWSFLAGLEENTRLMGTHISDRKPPALPAAPQPGANNNSPESSSAAAAAAADEHHNDSSTPDLDQQLHSATRFLSPPATHELHERPSTHSRRSFSDEHSSSAGTLNGFERGTPLVHHSTSSAAATSPSAIFHTAQLSKLIFNHSAGLQTILSILILLANMRPIRVALIS